MLLVEDGEEEKERSRESGEYLCAQMAVSSEGNDTRGRGEEMGWGLDGQRGGGMWAGYGASSPPTGVGIAPAVCAQSPW